MSPSLFIPTLRLVPVFLLIFTGADLFAQADTTQVRALYDSARTHYLSAGEKALAFAQEGYALALDQDHYWGKINCLQMIGEAYYSLGQLDQATEAFQSALDIAQEAKDRPEMGHNHVSLASVALDSGDKSLAQTHYAEAATIFEQLADSSSLCDLLLRYGNTYNSTGEHDEAIAQYLRSIPACEAAGNTLFVGFNYESIAIVHDKQGDYPIAESYFLKAKEVFAGLKDRLAYAGLLNNMGIFYKNTRQYDKSILSYQEALGIFDSVNFDRGRMACNTNLGILFTTQSAFAQGLAYSQRGLELARKMNNRESQGDNLNHMARAQLGLGQVSQALIHAREAQKLAYEVESLEKQRDANLTLSEVYQALGRYDEALGAYQAHVTAKDSLYDLDKARELNELRTRYETEKKDAEIALLAKNAEIDQIKKTRLWLGLTLSILLGSLLIFIQWQRRKNEQRVLQKEKELAEEKSRHAELEQMRLSRELDLKNQALTAKVLQLARKNEFLHQLEKEVQALSSRADDTAAKEGHALSRLIRQDIQTETDWDDFLASFREVHSEFMSTIQASYSGLSKTDLKLACLMKMNLSSKEIASALNISFEGVKKARYRLRKKLDLDSDHNLQEFLLAFDPSPTLSQSMI